MFITCSRYDSSIQYHFHWCPVWTSQHAVWAGRSVIWEYPGSFLGREISDCVISWSKAVVNRRLWKAASANCLCAVSQGCFVLSSSASLPWKPAVKAAQSRSPCSGEQWNICVLGERNQGGTAGKCGGRGDKLGGTEFPNRGAPLCLGQAVTLYCHIDGGGVATYSLYSHTVTVRWVCPSRLVKQSSWVPCLHRKCSASSSIIYPVSCRINRGGEVRPFLKLKTSKVKAVLDRLMFVWWYTIF